jgi:hypothetical protein
LNSHNTANLIKEVKIWGDHMEQQKELIIVDSELHAADALIMQLDQAIQDTRNLELSKQLNEISDCYEAIRKLMKDKS